MQPVTREYLLKSPLRLRQDKVKAISRQIYEGVLWSAEHSETSYNYICCEEVALPANDNHRSHIPTMEEIISELKKYLIDCTIVVDENIITISWEQNEMSN